MQYFPTGLRDRIIVKKNREVTTFPFNLWKSLNIAHFIALQRP